MTMATSRRIGKKTNAMITQTKGSKKTSSSSWLSPFLITVVLLDLVAGLVGFVGICKSKYKENINHNKIVLIQADVPTSW